MSTYCDICGTRQNHSGGQTIPSANEHGVGIVVMDVLRTLADVCVPCTHEIQTTIDRRVKASEGSEAA